MKKTLVAVAAMAAIAGAHADATISGSIEMGYNTNTANASGVKTTTKSLGDGHGNSSLNFNANEDLGGGMKADMQIGFLPIVDKTAGTQTSYQSWVGIEGGFGRIQGGAFADSQANVVFNYDAMGAWGLSKANFAAYNWGGYFTSNQLKYSLPTMISGLSASYTKSFGEATAGTKVGDANTYAVGYKAGGFSADYAYTGLQATIGTTTVISNTGVAYDFGVAKVMGLYASQKNGANDAVTGSSYAVSVPFGAAAIAVQSSSATKWLNSSSGAATSVAQTAIDWKVSYALSKRTTVYAMYGTGTGSNGSTTVSTSSSNQKTQLFVLHSF